MYDGRLHHHTEMEQHLEGTVSEILAQYATASSLEVDEFTKAATIDALKQAQEEGICLSMVII